MANLYKKEKKCRFDLSDTLSQPSYNYYFLATVKGSPYTDALTMGQAEMILTDRMLFMLKRLVG